MLQSHEVEPPPAENKSGILQERRSAAAITQTLPATDARVMQAVSSILSTPVERSKRKRSRVGSHQSGSRQAIHSQNAAPTPCLEPIGSRRSRSPSLHGGVAGLECQCRGCCAGQATIRCEHAGATGQGEQCLREVQHRIAGLPACLGRRCICSALRQLRRPAQAQACTAAAAAANHVSAGPMLLMSQAQGRRVQIRHMLLIRGGSQQGLA